MISNAVCVMLLIVIMTIMDCIEPVQCFDMHVENGLQHLEIEFVFIELNVVLASKLTNWLTV